MTKLLRWRCTAVFFTVDAKVSSSLGRTMGTTVTIAFLVLAFTVWVPKEKGASFSLEARSYEKLTLPIS